MTGALALTLGRLPVTAAMVAVAAAVAVSPGKDQAAILAAVFAAALVSSVAGFAFSPLCAVLLVFLPAIAEPAQLIALLLVASITIQSVCLWQLRADIPWRPIIPFLTGGIPLLPPGLLLAMHAPMEHYRTGLGILLVAYATWMLAKRPGPPLRRSSPWQDFIVGAAGGLTGGLAAFPSPPVVAWLCFRGVPKAPARAIIQAYIFAMQIAALGLLHLLAPAHQGAALDGAALLLVVPPAALGTLCGLAVYARLSDRQYGSAVNLLLLASGLAMLVMSG
ncbi:MAG TPA: TSUP family transporter [Roseococcus sp.]|nr:TSUP family transporter [Roseococcus sp.]